MKGHFSQRFLTLLLCFLFFWGCASSTNEDLEIARFALDSGNWDTAIKHAGSVLTNDRSNVEASLLLASAYAGKSGVKILDIFSKLADYAQRNTMYKSVHDALTKNHSTTYNSRYLREGILALTERLRPWPDENNESYLDHLFKTAVLYMIEIYATPAIVSQPTHDGEIDIEKITDEIKDIVESEFADTDDLFLRSGLEETDDPVRQVRYTRCQLQKASGTDDGFVKEALQDLVLCQLSDDPDSLSKDNGDLNSPNISICSDFKFKECEKI